MGGDIRVESVPRKGSTFYFTARVLAHPARNAAEDEKPERARPAPGYGAIPLRILLAEDNLVNRKLVARLLEKHGDEVELAGDGEEVLEKLAGREFDLILMDVQMPGLDGLETTRRIRQEEHGTGRRIPIIALTAHAMEGDRERCLEAGMDAYLTKPIRPRDLADSIDEIAAQRNSKA
jgi:CheY-like chemotaxis protein